ncbi:hypothetical protein ACTUVN_003157 [Pseudomonas caspiana]
MRYLVGIIFALCSVVNAYAEVCEYPAPRSEVLTYKKGEYLPIYFSAFQLDLPKAPSAFLAGGGFIAAYPDRGYVGLQHLDSAGMGDSLSRLSHDLTSVSDYYRLIYKIPSLMDGLANPEEINLQRGLLSLDCKSDVVLYRISDVQVIFHGAENPTEFHKIMLLDGDNVELIMVRGTRKMALRIVSSIKRRL